MKVPRVLVISLGGTIASTPTHTASGVVPQLSARDLVQAVPGLLEIAELETVSFRQLPSGDLTLNDVVALAHSIQARLGADDIDGVVITQGTDTIEETSFALDLLLDASIPVVITAAMRNPTMAGPDGPGNILAAVKVAASDTARDMGCVVVMNDEVHAARYVRKSHTSSLATFQSPNIGPLGWVVEDRVRILARTRRVAPIEIASLGDLPAVALVSCSLGDDGRQLTSLSSLGYRGAVIDGFGAGHVPAQWVATVESLTSEMPVVLCSRTGAGEVLSRTYGFAGSESDLLSRGVVSAGLLDARKARVTLTLSIASSLDRHRALERFALVRDSLTS